MILIGRFRAVAGSALTGPPRFQDTSSQILRDKLKLVRRKTLQKTAGLTLQRTIRARNQCGNQSASHGRSPYDESLDLSRIYHETVVRRKGAPEL
jgi:hypothetical protein